MELIIGNKNYSSWSLRAWLMLSVFGVAFDETKILLGREDTSRQIRKYNKAGKVPALIDQDLTVWDSLAICEYISETYLENRGWPAQTEARAVARSCSAEMHSGFFNIREKLPMNCRAANRKVEISGDLQQEITRVDDLLADLRVKFGSSGDYLFGEFTIADCMFAPVAFRFETYEIEVSQTTGEYMERLLHHPAMQQWLAQAREEAEVIASAEAGL